MPSSEKINPIFASGPYICAIYFLAIMPKDNSLHSVLIIGSGPIIIGQACEFDYAGTQAARSLREEGIKVILINSNPATIMTDPMMADKVYLLPLTVESIEKILDENQIDAVLPTMGGQTALNLCKEADELGVWSKYGVRLIGVDIAAIDTAEDREKFRQLMVKIGPIGAGGNSTALGVSILTYPTHIAGLPVAINISCHATRTAEITI